MTISKMLCSLFLSLLILHPNAQAKNTGSYFAFSKDKDQYLVELKGSKIFLKESPRTGLLQPVGKTKLPQDVEYMVQLSFLLSEKNVDSLRLNEIFDLLSSSYPQIKNVNLFTELSKKICFNKQDEQCLKELGAWIESELKDSVQKKKQRTSIYVLRARLSPNWVDQRAFFEKALKESPNDSEARYYAQIFSIEIAREVLAYYRSEIAKNGLYTALGLSTAKDGKFGYRDGLVETVANTYNVIRILSSEYFNDSYYDDIKARWLTSLEQLIATETQLTKTKRALVNISDMNQSTKVLRDTLPKEYLAKPFFQHLIQTGLYPVTKDRREEILFPNIHQFNISNVDEFSNPKLKQILKEQINFLNFFMLVRGPAVVQAFGKTKLGIQIVDKLRLKPLVQSMSKLRWPLNSLTVWVALETADGCLIRYTYIFYTVGDQISGDSLDEINTLLNSKGYPVKGNSK